ncbi:segregation and condensation protein A [Halomonas huangheensis]|uniref:segregation and condensation protein A n=1 Tax=Halomonas huangheensis TaxID=1178482 RepID=UPI001F1F3214|nr:ScpA family protein [Halomonas huangheensis]
MDVSTEQASDANTDAQSQVLGRIFDEPITELPEDLYIPPEALRVFLEAFEGPLDLLLYLIRRQNLDILTINVAAITHQYIEYVELMKAMEIELAGEYLLMAAMLAEIKSRTLLPRPPRSDEDGEEEDPRAELIRRLQEYEQLKIAAEALADLPRIGRDWFPARAGLPPLESRVIHPDVELEELLGALAGILHRAELNRAHHIEGEVLSTRERMLAIMELLHHERYTPFEALFTFEEGRAGVIVTFMAILELAKEAMIEIVQNEPLSPIHVRARLAEDTQGPEDEVFELEGESAFDDDPSMTQFDSELENETTRELASGDSGWAEGDSSEAALDEDRQSEGDERG